MNDADAFRSRVVLDARLYGGTATGDSTYWTSLIDALARLEPRPNLLLVSDRPLPYRGAFPVSVVPARSGRWWSLVTLPLLARRERAKLHVQYALSPLAKRGISTIHDVSFLIGPEWFSPKDRALLTLGFRSAVRRAEAIVTVSETSAEEILGFAPIARGRVHAIPNACPDWIRPVDGAEARRRPLGLEDPYALTVGTRWARKNMELAVAAMNGLPADVPHRLVVTGKSGGEGDLGVRGIATGYLDTPDLCAVYAGASLYLAPSRHEGFGIPVLEAMRLGCPVLVSPATVFREVGGDAVSYADSWDTRAWTEKIASLLRDGGTLQELSRRGRSREPRFTWAESARRHAELYRR